MSQFNPDDVRIVANALLSHYTYREERGLHEYFCCSYCKSWVYSDEDIKDIEHNLNCPVLVARDLLT